MSKSQPKTYTVEDMKAAWLRGKIQGRKEAEEFLQARINRVCITNHKLLVEIFRLDLNEPVVAVAIPYKFAQMCVHKLRKKNSKNWHARMIKYYMNRSDRAVFGNVENITEELEA